MFNPTSPTEILQNGLKSKAFCWWLMFVSFNDSRKTTIPYSGPPAGPVCSRWPTAAVSFCSPWSPVQLSSCFSAPCVSVWILGVRRKGLVLCGQCSPGWLTNTWTKTYSAGDCGYTVQKCQCHQQRYVLPWIHSCFVFLSDALISKLFSTHLIMKRFFLPSLSGKDCKDRAI